MTPFSEAPQTRHAKKWLDDDDGDSDSEGDEIIDLLSTPEPLKRDAAGKRLLDPDAFRSLTASPASANGGVPPAHLRGPSPRRRTQTWKSKVSNMWAIFWEQNRGVVLVALSQMFGSLMNLAARLLELEGEGMHPFQILFARMGLTTLISCIYMYKVKVPHFPFGPREVRGLLIARGMTGFFGIYGMWYSMMYLPLAEATVISFLAPSVAGYVCHVLIHDPFTRKEQIASVLALVGVVFIARPTSLFSSSAAAEGAQTPPAAGINATAAATNVTGPAPHLGGEATPAQRLTAIGVALVGVLGASGAFTTIRWIGKRAHPLISVNYFSTWCTLVSTVVLLLAPVLNIGQPAIHFALPTSLRQWLLLLFLGSCGMIMQFLLTSGLAGERSNRATAMVYTQMLFAAGFDKWIFGHEMGVVSLIGCGFIIGSALWVALTKKEKDTSRSSADVETGAAIEGEPMLRHNNRGEQDGEGDEIALELVR